MEKQNNRKSRVLCPETELWVGYQSCKICTNVDCNLAVNAKHLLDAQKAEDLRIELSAKKAEKLKHLEEEG